MRAPLGNLVLLCSGVLAAAGGMLAAWMVVPQFRELFATFGAELPLLTRLFVDSGGTLWGLPLLVPLLSLFVRRRGPEDTRPGAVAFGFGLATAFGLPLLCALAMYLPIFKLAAVVG